MRLRRSCYPPVEKDGLAVASAGIYASLLERNARRRTGPDRSAAANVYLVTAANHKFYLGLRTLLESARRFCSTEYDKIIVFDIGLTGTEVAELSAMDDVCVCDDLLPLVSETYISTYRFKLDAMLFSRNHFSDCRGSSIVLYIDSGILVRRSIANIVELTRENGYFVCDLYTRKLGGKPGTGVRLLHHLPPVEVHPVLRMDREILTMPLLWTGILAFVVGSSYDADVVLEAFCTATKVPHCIAGPKFPDESTRERIEASETFRSTLEDCRQSGLELCTQRWNGHRHDLFLTSYLTHLHGYPPLSSLGRIEDITDGLASKRTQLESGLIRPTRSLDSVEFQSETTVFVIHRGSLHL